MSRGPISQLKGVIFDCDGVIIDSTAANREFYNLVLEHYGLPRMTKAQEKYAFMATARQALEHILPASLHSGIDRMGRDVVNYRQRIMPLVKIFPGFLEFVELLHRHGLKMAVLTNRTEAGMKAVLDFFALPPYFDPVVTASSGAPKPSPAGAQSILAQWQCDTHEVLFVGDSEVDRATALAAGIPFAGLSEQGTLDGDFRVESYAALQKLLAPYLEDGSPVRERS